MQVDKPHQVASKNLTRTPNNSLEPLRPRGFAASLRAGSSTRTAAENGSSTWLL
jgi:hypothetical protein